MKNKTLFQMMTSTAVGIFSIGSIFWSAGAPAGDITWRGRYRVEGLALQNPPLDDSKQMKAYILHHLILQPEFVPADGFKIFSQFDIMNNSDVPNSQMGQVLGGQQSPSTTGCTSNTPGYECSKVMRDAMPDDTLRVTQLYMTWSGEYSVLSVGRMPFQFGLGMTNDSGSSDFDHWMSTRDLVAYTVKTGNLVITPMFGKAFKGELIGETDINYYSVQVQYENPETDLVMGFLYDTKNSPKWSKSYDVPTGSGAFGGANATTGQGGYNSRNVGIFVSRKLGPVNVGFEGGFLSAQTGVMTAAGRDVQTESYGLALELDYQPVDSRTAWNLKTGVASGDKTDTNEKYEGYFFHRNYDVGMLLFNHHLGSYNVTGSRSLTGARSASGLNSRDHLNSYDSDALTNALYFSPGFRKQINEKWSWSGQLVYASLQESQVSGADKYLGTEVDLGLQYRPQSKLLIGVDFGSLFPGEAFKGGSSGYRTDISYGLMTKAAINF